jgi:hypothetical protein
MNNPAAPEPIAAPPAGGASADEKKWERWIRGVRIGTYVLAVLGIAFYTVVLRRADRDWSGLMSSILGITIYSVILLILDFAIRVQRPDPVSGWIVKAVTIVLTAAFVAIVVMAMLWAKAIIWQDIRSRTEPETHLIRPSEAAKGKVCYDGRATLKRVKDGTILNCGFVADEHDINNLGGCYITFDPEDGDEIEADMYHRCTKSGKPFRIRFSKASKTFDLIGNL